MAGSGLKKLLALTAAAVALTVTLIGAATVAAPESLLFVGGLTCARHPADAAWTLAAGTCSRCDAQTASSSQELCSSCAREAGACLRCGEELPRGSLATWSGHHRQALGGAILILAVSGWIVVWRLVRWSRPSDQVKAAR
jgi:hypothetical protein